MEKRIRIGLWILVIGLSYTLYRVIMNPIRFNTVKNSRSEDVIQRLKDVRKAQIAFKEVNRYYASNFDELIPLIDTGVFTIVQRRDEELKYYNKLYREFQLKDTTFIDTLGYASIKDSIFGENYNCDKERKKCEELMKEKPHYKQFYKRLKNTLGNEIDRVKFAANAKGLGIYDFIPTDPSISENPPYIGFSLLDEKLVPSIDCFVFDMVIY